MPKRSKVDCSHGVFIIIKSPGDGCGLGVKPQVSGLDLAGYSTAKLIRSEGSTTRLKSQTKRKTENPPMCCCVADAITNEYKFLKRHNEKFEMVVNIGGSSSRVAGEPSARFFFARAPRR
jgi:hypothetical protein